MTLKVGASRDASRHRVRERKRKRENSGTESVIVRKKGERERKGIKTE